ncbi:uncharacterized protein UTRI_10167 [Ustilago trichophora]|uniref:Uncharacterized protein n=1 Tax=Ustilago trichophora TaxID=86804 RepID=A0A5C3EDL3_9BASI|nr:uncharacterized protein UTRI_10167 [Ustilago trichophora]
MTSNITETPLGLASQISPPTTSANGVQVTSDTPQSPIQADPLLDPSPTPPLTSPHPAVAPAPSSITLNLPLPGRGLPSTQSTSTRLNTTGRRNHSWTSDKEVAFVTAIFNNVRFQQSLLPSRPNNKVSNPLRKDSALAEIAKIVFPAEDRVDKNRMKSKLARLIKSYYKIKKEFLLTGAGSLSELEPSNPAYLSLKHATEKYKWFEKMHHMMIGRYCASDMPATLFTTPALDSDSDEQGDAIMAERNDFTIESSSFGHANHACQLPELIGMLPGSNIERAVSATPSQPESFPSTPPPCQAQRSTSVSGDVFTCTTLSPISTQASQDSPSGHKRKRTGVEPKRDSVAEAYYRSQVDTAHVRLQIEQEKTRRTIEKLQIKLAASKERKEKEIQERMQEREKYFDVMERLAMRMAIAAVPQSNASAPSTPVGSSTISGPPGPSAHSNSE